MKKNMIALILVGAIITAFAVIAPVLGSPGGIGNKDLQANSCSVHDIVGSDIITMSASKLNPTPGEQITITVSVSGSQGSGAELGVSLLTALSGSTGTLPSDKGWTIVSDPSGTTYNYNEKAYSGSATFTWTLNVPASAGSYNMYARAYMGPSIYYKDATQGLTFTVGTTTVAAPTVLITAPASSATVRGSFSVIATATPGAGASVTSVILRVDGTMIGTLTAAPYSWIVDSTKYVNGAHTINVTAVDNVNRNGYAQQKVTINNLVTTPSDTPAPIVTITNPINGTVISGKVNVSANITASVSIANLTLNLDGVIVSTLSKAPFVWQADSEVLSAGTHVLQVDAFDTLGVLGTAQSMFEVRAGPVTIDMVVPPTNSGIVYLTPTIKTTDTISHVLYFLDGVLAGNVTSAPYAYSLDTTAVPDGSHGLNITAVTASGVKWFEEFAFDTLNNLEGTASGNGGSTQFVLTGIDLLIMQALLVVLVLGIVLKVGGRKKGPDGGCKNENEK